jgi:heptose I phosphotransferase
MTAERLIKISDSVFIDPDFKQDIEKIGLANIDDIFSFNQGINLKKQNISKHRTRLQIELKDKRTTIFLKRYNNPPILTQLKNWCSSHKKISSSFLDFEPAEKLSSLGINTPKTILLAQQWGIIFEKRSAIATLHIPNAQSLEKKLPWFFTEPNNKQKKKFIKDLAEFVKKFHDTGYRHRDLYFAHIFYNQSENIFHLIDLARAFKPVILKSRFTAKDLAQLYYSAPAKFFTMTDRLRFYKIYTGKNKLTRKDKAMIRKIKIKIRKMSEHDKKHNRSAPYTNR